MLTEEELEQIITAQIDEKAVKRDGKDISGLYKGEGTRADD